MYTWFKRLPAAVAAALLAAGTFAVSAAAADASVHGPWVSLIDGAEHNPPLKYRPSPYPHTGVTIFSQKTGDASSHSCTVSWPIKDADGDYGFLTAGHCLNPGDDQLSLIDREDQDVPLPRLVGREVYTDSAGLAHDSSWFYLPNHARMDDAMVTPGAHIRGVMTVDEVKALPRGTPMCMVGARSGLSCGPFLGDHGATFEWGGIAVPGDSGGPIFVVNSSGDGLAVGMLKSGTTDTDNFGTYLYPVLARDDLRLVVSDA